MRDTVCVTCELLFNEFDWNVARRVVIWCELILHDLGCIITVGVFDCSQRVPDELLQSRVYFVVRPDIPLEVSDEVIQGQEPLGV